MGWTDRLNASPGRIRLGATSIDIYHWAEMAATVVNPLHRHTYFEVCWVEKGRGEFVVEGHRHQIGPGSLLFARPGVPHQIISDREPGIRLVWVAFRLRQSAEEGELAALFGAFARSTRPLAHDSRAQIASLWSTLRTAGTGPVLPGQDAVSGSVAQALLIALAQAGAENIRPPSADPFQTGDFVVRQAVRYIQDNLERPLSVEELARHVHLSPRQLTRLFRIHTGQSPAGYVEWARLDHAAVLLVRSGTPIKQIAGEVGYGDVAVFTRAFSRRLGTPPGRFRQNADLQPVLTAPPHCPE